MFEVLLPNLPSSYHIATRERITPAFSGRANGATSNHVKCAARAPLQRIVRWLVVALCTHL